MRQDPATVKITETDQAWFVAQKVSAERGTADTISETGHAAVCWWCVSCLIQVVSFLKDLVSSPEPDAFLKDLVSDADRLPRLIKSRWVELWLDEDPGTRGDANTPRTFNVTAASDVALGSGRGRDLGRSVSGGHFVVDGQPRPRGEQGAHVADGLEGRAVSNRNHSVGRE